MKITCQSCGAKYSIADEKVRGRKVKVRCKSCSTAMVVDGTAPEEEYSEPVDDDEATRIVDTRAAFGASEPAPAADAWSVNLSDTDQRTMTTDEIVAAYHAGELGQDAFVWREGMGDWLPVTDVPELVTALGAGAPAPAPAYAPPAPALPSFGAAAPTARVSGGRATGGLDLFGNVDAAGAEPAAPPPSSAPMAGTQEYDEKPTGARNENSVLFSLDALKAGFSGNAPAPAGRPPPRRAEPPGGSANLDDLMNIGGGGGNALFGLGANQALLTAPAPPEPEPPPPPPPSVPPPWQAGSVPPAPTSGSKNKLIIAIGGGVAALVVLGVALAFAFGGKKPEQVAKNDVTAAADKANSKTSAAGDKKADDKPADDKKADDKPADDRKADDKPADDKKADDKPADDKTPVTDEEKKRFFEAQKKKAEEAKTADKAPDKAPDKKTDDKPVVKDNPSSGLASFNKGAAISALSAAASAATGCKRPDGPTGSGRAIVTFAPSGRATSANVTGGSFGGTSVGGCVASVFRRAHVPPFSGSSVTVAKSFNIP